MKRWVPPLLAAWAFLALHPAPASAQDNTWVDRYHTYVENDMYGTVAWFDRFFGSDLYEEAEDPESFLRLTNDFRYDQQEHFDYRFRIRARIRLPRMKGKMRLLISGENKGDPTAIRPEDPGNPGLAVTSLDRRASTELVYDLFKSRNTIVAAGAGVHVSTHPSLYARTRLLNARELAYSVIRRLAVTPFWDTSDGFGVSSQLELERPIASSTLLRWTNDATISEKTVGWLWGTELAVLRQISRESAVTFAANASGSTRPEAEVQNYRVYARYRFNILRSWLFCELEPDVNWPRQEGGGWKTVLGGTMRLELNFTGRRSSPAPP